MNTPYGYAPYGAPSQAWPVAIVICLLIGIIAALVLFFGFLGPRNDGKYTGFVGWFYEFLNFRKLLLEAVLRIVYMNFAVFLTLIGIVYVFIGFAGGGANFLIGLGIIVIGNVLLRLTYEFIMLTVSICKNVSDINRKMGGGKSVNNSMPPMNPFTNPSNMNRPQPPVNPQAPAQNFMPQQFPVNSQAPVQHPTAPLQAAQPSVNPQSQNPNAASPSSARPQQTGPVPSSPMVFCRNCGKQFSADSAACPHCGTPRRK